MKRTGKLLAAVLCLLCLLAQPALAAQTADLITLDKTTDLVVIVSYDTEEPEMAFLSPDGGEYAESLGNVTVERGDKVLYFHLNRAQPGQWQVRYDKKGNQELTIRFAQDVQSVFLTELTVQPPENDWAQVSFLAEYPEETSCNYIVYAALLSQDGQVSGQKELARGSVWTNQPAQVNVPLRDLATYDDYHIMVEVYLESGGVEVFDSAVSAESFAYESPNAHAPLENMALTVDLADNDLLIDWTQWRAYSCESYLLAVFRQGEDEPFFAQEYESGVTAAAVLADRTDQQLRVELTYRRGGRMSQTLTRTVDLSQADWVTIATPESTNAAQARVDYRVSTPIQAQAELNGVQASLSLEGENFFSLPIQDGVNQLSISYSPEENLTFIVRREIVCDRIAPMLRLFEVDGTVYTDKASYLLAGQAELGCSLLIEGTPVELGGDGTFLHELPLSPGENRFQVELTDPAGNRTVQELYIEQGQGAAVSVQPNPTGPAAQALSWLPLILTLAVSVLVLVGGLLLFRRGKDGKRRVGRSLAVLLVLADVLLIGAAIYCTVQYFILFPQVNTAAFLELSQTSLSQAYQLLEKYHFFRRWMLYTLCGAGGLTAVGVVWLLLHRRKKTKRPPEQGNG